MEIKSKTTPWQHQRMIVEKAINAPAYGVFVGPAGGKTKIAVDIIANRGHKLVLVVTTKKALDDRLWEREIQLHGYFPDGCMLLPLTEGSSTHKAQLVKAARVPNKDVPLIIITNYDTVWRGELGKFIRKIKWDCVILDEAHKIRAAGSKVSRFFGFLGPKVGQRLALTGTPNPNSPLDVYGVYRFLDPSIFGTRYDVFSRRYALYGGPDNRFVIEYMNLDELHQKMFRIATYLKTEDVVDLPPYRHIYRMSRLEPVARIIYDKLKKDFIAEMVDGLADQQQGIRTISVSNTLTKILRLHQITGGLLSFDDKTAEDIGSPKYDMIFDELESMPTRMMQGTIARREPVVIFAVYRHDISKIREACKRAGYLFSEMSGTINQLEDWKQGKTDALIVQIQSGAEGLNLTRARYAIYYSKSYDLGLFEQSLARIRRPDRNESVTYIHLIVDGTIDRIIDEALIDKKNIVQYVLEKLRDRV